MPRRRFAISIKCCVACPKQIVFAQTLLGFETAVADPRVVGHQLRNARRRLYIDVRLCAAHARLWAFLHGLYPKVHISLHAGELAPGLVPPEGLCCHIRLAVEEAHAERIGHGVEVMYEDRPYDLLKEMAQKHIMVEINLTSNDVILGVSGQGPSPSHLSQIWSSGGPFYRRRGGLTHRHHP